MSESEDDERVAKLNFKKDRIHFGGLDEDKKKDIRDDLPPGEEGSDSSEEEMEDSKSGDGEEEGAQKLVEFSVSDGVTSEKGGKTVQTVVDEHQQQLLQELEQKKKARNIAVPTEDIKVKAMLRDAGEPICLFGEGPYERRERLKVLLVSAGKMSGVVAYTDEAGSAPSPAMDGAPQEKKQEVWYHEGSGDLKRARYFIAEFSVPAAKKRLKEMRDWQAMNPTMKHSERQDVHKFVHTLNNECSQIGDTRPLSYCSISPCSNFLATASWSGLVKLWSLPSCNPVATLQGHIGRVGAAVFSPKVCDENTACLASCDSDGLVYLWSMGSTKPVGELPGHGCRVSRLNYHPSGRFIATACYDQSWRLWDLSKSAEILHQEGHSAPVYSVAFHRDGSLLATGGLDSYCRVWDLRTGRAILFLEGHLKSVLSCDFSMDGYHLATGSEDNSCKIWDLRQHKSIYNIPAHSNMVTYCKFSGTPTNSMLLTASYDKTAKVWSHKGWMPLKNLTGHDNKVMCVDCSWDRKYIVTASYDRTFKLWSSKGFTG